MTQHVHPIQGVLDIAFRVAEGRSSSDEDVALGLIAALRRIHVAAEEMHEGMALRLRGEIRDIIIAHNLERLRESKALPSPAALPKPNQSSARLAIALLEDAANSCLALNALTPNNECVKLAVHLLMRRLIAAVGGAPDYSQLIDRIAGPAAGSPSVLSVPQGPRPRIN
jgi:hypothetical protein